MHRYAFRAAVCAAAAVLCGACSTTIPNDYSGADAGAVVVGIGATGSLRFNSFALRYRVLQGDATSMFRYQGDIIFRPKADYEDDTERGYVLVQHLPPGEYEIHSAFNSFPSGFIEARQAFSIRFTVAPSTVTYLGNYQSTTIWQGFSPVGFTVAVEDRQGRDLSIAKSKLGKMADGPVRNVTPNPYEIKSPIFVAPKRAKTSTR